MKFSPIKINSTLSIPFDENNCYFVARSLGESSLIQIINVQSFSVLIDTDRGRFNISAYMGCLHGRHANLSIILSFLSDNGIPSEQYIG